QRVALGVVDVELKRQVAGSLLHRLYRTHPVLLVGMSGADERDPGSLRGERNQQQQQNDRRTHSGFTTAHWPGEKKAREYSSLPVSVFPTPECTTPRRAGRRFYQQGSDVEGLQR